MKITYKGVTKDIKFYKGLKWNKPLTPKMEQYKSETGKNPIRGGTITGTFEYWMYWKSKQNKTKTKEIKKKKNIQQVKPKKIDYNITGYREISVRKEVLNGMKVEITRVECACCKGILDFYYLDDFYSIPQVLKIEVIKEGPKHKKHKGKIT